MIYPAIHIQLLALFNEAVAASGVVHEFALTDLTFGEPELYDEGALELSSPYERNTLLPVSAVIVGVDDAPDQELAFQLHYNRLSLALLFGPRASSFVGLGIEESTHDSLDEIAAFLNGFPITVDDVEDLPVASIDANSHTVFLKAKPGSLAVFGAAVVISTFEDATPAV